MKVITPLYHATGIIVLSVALLTIILRTFVRNSIYMAPPTALWIGLILISIVRPYREEIALYYAKAKIIQIIPVLGPLNKVIVETNIYKLSFNWLSFEERNKN